MTESEAQPEREAWDQRFVGERARLKEEAKVRAKAGAVLAPLAKPAVYQDYKKLSQSLDKVRAKLGATAPTETAVLLSELEAWLVTAPEQTKREVSRGLKALCDARGVTFTVVSREDPVKLRLPPFGVTIDFLNGKAELTFALHSIAACAANAEAILAKRQDIMQEWDAGFDAARFHERCRRAWRASRAVEEAADERVEILKFLPQLALQTQAEKFAVDPSSKNFRSYGRARFAYDISKLRRERKFEQNGWRLNLGVATGSSAQEKKRVVYFEDENGDGEYKLTVYFTRVGGEG